MAPVSAPAPAQNLDVIIAKDQVQGETPTQAVHVPAPSRSGPALGQGLLRGPALFHHDIFPRVTLQPAPQLLHVAHSAPAFHKVLSPAHRTLTPAHRVHSPSHRMPPPTHPITNVTHSAHPVNQIEEQHRLKDSKEKLAQRLQILQLQLLHSSTAPKLLQPHSDNQPDALPNTKLDAQDLHDAQHGTEPNEENLAVPIPPTSRLLLPKPPSLSTMTRARTTGHPLPTPTTRLPLPPPATHRLPTPLPTQYKQSQCLKYPSTRKLETPVPMPRTSPTRLTAHFRSPATATTFTSHRCRLLDLSPPANGNGGSDPQGLIQ